MEFEPDTTGAFGETKTTGVKIVVRVYVSVATAVSDLIDYINR